MITCKQRFDLSVIGDGISTSVVVDIALPPVHAVEYSNGQSVPVIADFNFETA